MENELFGKITLYAVNNQGGTVTENLGYTDINLCNSETPSSLVSAIRGFAQQINLLTTNTYTRTDVTYNVNLDTFEP